ncbi:MAG: hypothetical protein EPN84_06085 [Legionella sp.]|nr:MAG: hypothetical protein EPN84_06085 [Legionella sp.]
MKITDMQRTAASYYWAQILNGEVLPAALAASTQRLPSFMAVQETMNRTRALERLAESNPMWSLGFMNKLDALLRDADVNTNLWFDNEPQGLLLEAAEAAKIPKSLFPIGKLSMTFDDKGNMNVGGEIIDASEFVKCATKSNDDDNNTPNWCLLL